MSTPPNKAAKALAGSSSKVEILKDLIESIQDLKRELEIKFKNDTKVLMEHIEHQTLKFGIHTAKLSLRESTIEDDSDSITMRLRIISLADKRHLDELQQEASDLIWEFGKQKEKFAGRIENLDREMALWMQICTLQETWGPLNEKTDIACFDST